MKIKHDDELMMNAIRDLKLDKKLNLQQMSPILCEYEKGELFSGPHMQQKYILFMYSGKAQIYGADREGRKIPVNMIQKGSVVGDIEFWSGRNSSLYTEALTPCIMIGFSVRQYRNELLNDNGFLRCLLDSITEKVYLSSFTDTQETSVREKLLDYMKYNCPDHTFTGVEQTTLKIRCSRRQLQRVIAELQDEGLIEKIHKGTYRLIDLNYEQLSKTKIR